jgi:predicted lipid-binding transport protein (Tim44 family)
VKAIATGRVGRRPTRWGLKSPDRHSKLLNLRDFQAWPGFPLFAKRGYNSEAASGRERRLSALRVHYDAEVRHWLGKVSCLHAADQIHEVVPACRSVKGTFYRRLCYRCRSESEHDVDIYTIIFLALAVFIFLRLRSVLGQRTGSERPPYDRAARNIVQGAPDNKVLPVPGSVIEQVPLAPTADVAAPADRWKGMAEPGTPLADGLDAVTTIDPSFDPKHFLSGARSAYEMIVLAFANGDRRALKDLLSTEVYESFESAIKDREKQERKTETRFVSIDKAELVGAEARDRAAQLTVRFVSQMISVTRDKTGAIVDGNPDKVTDITDVWTFARDVTSRDPNWKLVGTGSAH